MSSDARIRVERPLPWTAPLAVATGLAGRDGSLCLLSDPAIPGSRSFVAAEPDEVRIGPAGEDLFAAVREPGFAEGVVGLAGYDAGARPATGDRVSIWPDMMLARYPALLVFDHDGRALIAVGWGEDEAAAQAACDRAEAWLGAARVAAIPSAPADVLTAEASPEAYVDAVAEVVGRIAAGELFQANIARAWGGTLKPEADPFDVFLRLASGGAAPYGAWWRLGDRALVSNSPELFLACDRTSGRIETRPIKGTRGRQADAAADAAAAAELLASGKDRAENLMIVDLMRNDLARVCAPGSVRVETLFAVESHPTVHHLVSTVTGLLAGGQGPAEALAAAFPPGSITGAPKHQAMKVIAALEPPRGPWCGSLFMLDEAGDLTASVLIRTASFEKLDGVWRYRVLAGAGIVADSDPGAELAETEVKFSALRLALDG